MIDYDALAEKYSGTGKLYAKLQEINKFTDLFKMQLENLSKRYDERLENFMCQEETEID